MPEVGDSWIVQVRERLASPPPRRLPPDGARQAAVLVPLFVDAGELWTFLTRRSERLVKHRGQIAFPGGGREIGEDAWSAAVRETEEEIGLESRAVIQLGELDETETPSGFRIVPCVGAVPRQPKLEPDAGEIAEVFPVPLLAFTDVRLVEDHEVDFDGRRQVLRIYHVAGRRVWGLTARILQNLLERLGVGTLEPR